MKISFVWFGLLFPVFCLGQSVLSKPAVLILPDQIEYRKGSRNLMSGEIGFRWDGEEPLKISVWEDKKTGKPDQLLIDIEIFDEHGRLLEQQLFVSIPPMPSGEAIIARGEYRQFGAFVWNGSVQFLQSGNYYAIAVFNSAWTGKTNVVFTTNKRWFRVIEAPAKNSSL